MNEREHEIACTMAAKMLLTKRNCLPASLEERLLRTQQLMYSVGGVMGSRQVIAMIVMQWEMEARLKLELE